MRELDSPQVGVHDDDSFEFRGIRISAGESREIFLKASESYLSSSVHIPVTVIRGSFPGPTCFITAAIHGDEINGVDIVRRLIYGINPKQLSGTLIAIPVVNIPGFLAQSRYLHYHRDLNRFFPGSKNGNNAERFAHKLFEEVVKRCDFGIDLHTAAQGRVNLPHIRADMSHPRVRVLARAFGASVVIDNCGQEGALRREATKLGVPTIIFEAGESLKFSQRVSSEGYQGVVNVLQEVGMLPAQALKRKKPPFQVIVKSSQWVRAKKGGILDLAVRPGDLVYKGDRIGSILDPFGSTVTEMVSPHTGIIIGVTTAPLSVPGTGVVHLARLKKTLAKVEASFTKSKIKKRKRP